MVHLDLDDAIDLEPYGSRLIASSRPRSTMGSTSSILLRFFT